MVRSDGDRDLARIVASIRAVSTELETLAGNGATHAEVMSDGEAPPDSDDELKRAVASIRRVSENLQALASSWFPDADPDDDQAAAALDEDGVAAEIGSMPHAGVTQPVSPPPLPRFVRGPGKAPGERSPAEAPRSRVSTRTRSSLDDRKQPSPVSHPPERGAAEGVGGRLQLIANEIYTCGAALMALVEDGGGADKGHSEKILAPLAKLLDNVETQVCRISIIGQVKAGKSCLTNAFVGQPGLLPTGVNPWTGVVTELHLGDPEGREAGAEFYFFGEAEWRRLVEGGGRLRELTERYVPDFDEERLREMIEGIRQRVKERLGPDFDRLLGQHHHFAACDAELLEKYVCSGAHATARDLESSLGKFSDLTRLAEVYLPKGDFDFPSIVVDTPGTNDPLLVRDEITRQSLLSSDVHIVVLTAHQTLTVADLSLLRILNGLNKERIIIFINRIDQLNDIAPDAETIAASVRSWMGREFPGVAIPILAGSAWWAECALQASSVDVSSYFSAPLVRFARAIGAASSSKLARLEADPVALRDEIARLTSICSGLPALKVAVSDMMLQGPQASYLRQAIGVLLTLASFVETSINAERAHIVRGAELPRRVDTTPVAEVEQVHERANDLRALSTGIKRLIKAVGDELETMGQEAKAHLADNLQRAVVEFSSREALRLRDASAKETMTTWQCETHALRRGLENVLALSYGATRIRVLVTQKAAVAELRRLISKSGLAAEISIGDGPLADLYPPPPLAALGRTVAMDLSAHWWSHLWKRGRTIDQNCANLDRIIREEFYPVVEEIVRSSEVDFRKHIVAVVTQFLTLCADLVQALHQDYAGFAAIERKPRPENWAGDGGTLLDIGAALTRSDERLAECREIAARLRDVLTRFPA